jgi:alcohol dehydrogenase class IV
MADNPETIFTYAAPALKFGAGAADEIGFDLSQLGVGRVLVVTDAGVAATGAPDRVAEGMRAYGIGARVFADVHVEPTDASVRRAAEAARDGGPWDAFVAVGGGSSIDTAKAVNLLTTNPGDLMDYVNAPVGAGRAPQRALKPLVAVPTTSGTGSESTTICVLDVLSLRVKTGISHARLRPTMAVVDPLLTVTQPAQVTAASGMDILCHALESYTARPYTDFPRKAPHERVPYCGANPVADMWAEKALRLVAGSLRAAVADGGDLRARTDLALAATMAGMGFGNAGVHIPHANAYPIAGGAHDFRPAGYPAAEPLVPHGMAVALTAPAAFRFTYAASPDRHLRAAELLAGPGAGRSGPGAGRSEPGAGRSEPGDRLSDVLVDLIRDIGLPNGIRAVGYLERDVDRLVEGALKQQRLLATAPRPVTGEDLAKIFLRSLALWT